MWKYIITDRRTGTVLIAKHGCETKEDTRLQAEMDAKVENIKNYEILVEEETEKTQTT